MAHASMRGEQLIMHSCSLQNWQLRRALQMLRLNASTADPVAPERMLLFGRIILHDAQNIQDNY
jgi:hypothetical protein